MAQKIHLYFVPGTAASSKIFEHLSLPENLFEVHLLEWILPTHKEEPIVDYAKRMCAFIKHENPVLIGVSFGGLMAQEMSKHIQVSKIVLISSVKSNREFSKLLHGFRKTKSYLLFPSQLLNKPAFLKRVFIGATLKKKRAQYDRYLSKREPLYLDWAIYALLHWKQESPLPNTLHIQGTKDAIFPVKYLQNYIPVQNGSHVMILTRAREISNLLTKHLPS